MGNAPPPARAELPIRSNPLRPPLTRRDTRSRDRAPRFRRRNCRGAIACRKSKNKQIEKTGKRLTGEPGGPGAAASRQRGRPSGRRGGRGPRATRERSALSCKGGEGSRRETRRREREVAKGEAIGGEGEGRCGESSSSPFSFFKKKNSTSSSSLPRSCSLSFSLSPSFSSLSLFFFFIHSKVDTYKNKRCVWGGGVG